MHKIFALLLMVLCCIPLHGQVQVANGKDAVLLIRHVADFEVTGDGRSPAWQNTEWIPLTERRGNVDYTTKAKLLYSDSGVYCLFYCSDKKITATMREDFAELFKEDVVEVFFWPDESIPLYFEYELSPLNHEVAILVPNFNGDFLGWRPWRATGPRATRHATKINKTTTDDASWTAEFFIPYALLKPLQNVPPKKGTQWRVNLYRIDYDNGTAGWSWQPVRTTFHDFEMFGVMRFD
jgi:hypothetical protein